MILFTFWLEVRIVLPDLPPSHRRSLLNQLPLLTYPLSSFSPQCLHWVGARGTQCGKPRGRQRDSSEQERGYS